MPRGAPRGNQNAKGHGAPKGNRNAETHGANSRPDTTNFTNADFAQVDAAKLLGETLGYLTAKRIDLEHRMDILAKTSEDRFITSGYDTTAKNGTRSTVCWESKATRAEKLDTAYIRILGNILKVTEAMQKNAVERERLELDREKLKLSREKALGVFEDDEG